MDFSRRSATLAVAAMLASTLATAQSRLGELLDAGAKQVTADQFREEIVQRSVQGALEPGVNVEIVYTPQGTLEGVGAGGAFSYSAEWAVRVRGTWSAGDNDDICATVTLDGPTIRASYRRRCQFWFSLGDRYFVADSRSDRKARAIGRMVK